MYLTSDPSAVVLCPDQAFGIRDAGHATDRHGLARHDITACATLLPFRHRCCRELNNSGLEGPLQWAPLAQLSQLQVLNLYNNSLSGSLGGPLPASLSFLSASLNLLNGTIPAGWTLPPSLTELWLALNSLSGNIPSDLQVWRYGGQLRCLRLALVLSRGRDLERGLVCCSAVFPVRAAVKPAWWPC